jgi:hypothetical protein
MLKIGLANGFFKGECSYSQIISGKKLGEKHGSNAFRGAAQTKIPFCWEPLSG